MAKRLRTETALNIVAEAFETHDALMITDADANIIRVNKAFETITGYSEEEVLGKNPRILKSGRHSKSFYLALWQGLLRNGFWSGEVWDKHKNGDIYPKHLTITAIKNSEGLTTEYVASFLDITDRKKGEIELFKYRAIINSSEDAIISKALDGVIETWNLGAEKIFGYTASEVIGSSMEMLIPPNRRHEETEILALIKLGEKVDHFETVRRHKDGHLIDISATISPIRDDTGTVIGASKIARDVGLRKQAETIQRESDIRIKTILDNLFSYVALLDIDGKVQEVNKAPLIRAGYRYEDVVGKYFYDAPWWSYDSAVKTQLMEAMEAARQGRTSRYDVTVKMGNDLIPIDFQISPVFDSSGKIFGLLPTAVDITDRKHAEAEIHSLAYHDSLTGLPNRRLFNDRLEQEMRKAERSNQLAALLLIDLDNFKEVNDTLGHDSGDFLLIEAAKRIRSSVRDYDTVARLGGDEFTVILSELSDFSDIGRIAQNIIESLSRPFLIKGRELFISASIGVALTPDDATDAVNLIKDADQAMYQAKKDGRGRYHFFTKGMQQAAEMKAKMLSDLRRALSEGQFEVYYQPIIELATGRIDKAEALLRWIHPEHGFISPAAFIPLAEDTGAIHEIGDWVFMQAAQQVRRLTTEFGRNFQISVNKSPVQFKSIGNDPLWIDKLAAMNLGGNSIVIEITEGLLMNDDECITGSLLNYRDAGLQVAIDDFGTGYSALSYLKKFDIDYLKIDQSFTRNLVPGSSDLALCEAIVVMAHKLGLKVIAEGVETEQQRVLLLEIGCDYGQGYLFSKPVPATEFEKLLVKD